MLGDRALIHWSLRAGVLKFGATQIGIQDSLSYDWNMKSGKRDLREPKTVLE